MNKVEDFWNWFGQNEYRFFIFEANDEALSNKIQRELCKVDPDLTFEIGPLQNGRRQFVISAGGIKRAFHAVTSLTSAAPALSRWVITAFRPRRKELGIVELQGRRVHPKNVRFTLLDNGVAAGIYLFLPEYKEPDPILKQIGYLLLDDAWGEFDVETKLAIIKMFPFDADTEGERFPLSELAQQFDHLVRTLQTRPSDRPFNPN